MKRKFLSVLLALVLVLSFSLVTAVPMATPAKAATTLNVVPFTLITAGDGSAAWSTSENHTGTSSVLLDAGTVGGANAGRVEVLVDPIPLADFTGASYYVWEPTGTQHGGEFPYVTAHPYGDPYINIYLDTDDDGVVDEYLEGLGSVAVPASDPPPMTHPTPTPETWVQMEEGYGFYDSDDGLSSGNWTSAHAVGTLAEWKTYLATAYPDPLVQVVGVKITFGFWTDDVTLDVYVDDIAINGVTYYGKIQDAIDTATAGDTISVAAGTYTEDLTIPATKSNLELVGATGATIKGVETEPDASFPLAVPNIDILSSGVKIHGFTIEGPNDVSGEYASGMLIGASNVEIYANSFNVTAGRATWAGPVSTGIVTYRKTAVPTVDISGLNIHDNTFTNHGTGAAGFDAIFINIDAGTGTATISDNEFTGNVARAISVERSNVVISGNSIVTDLAPYTASAGGYQGMYIGCFPVGTDPGPVSANVSITGNTVKGSTTSKGFAQGIRVGHTTQVGLTNITVSRNIVQDSDEGITVRADASGVTVNYNEITGNTVGVQNDDTGVELDAQYNWYGGVAGPQHSTNPYNTEATSQSNDSVSDDVDFLPWMIHDTLVSGWNIWSTPIAPATGQAGEPDTNTVTEALDFWTADSTKVTDAYYFDSSSQAWAVPTSLTPLQAVYLKLSASATIDVCVSDSNYAPPGRTMHLGWNLVGTADWDDYKLIDAALTAAYYGTGQTDLVGYQYVISPSIHQTSWTFVRGGTTTSKYFVPTEGYWVYMVNQGVLNGFTYTPITP